MHKITLFISFVLSLHFSILSSQQAPLISTESDPDAFILDCVNVLNGDYCESATDFVISGPDSLLLQRFYSTKDPILGKEEGSWRIFPERFLIIGNDPANMKKTLAFTGERSGGILPYSGFNKKTLKIDQPDLGMVNTYAGEMTGQTNHLNNRLQLQENAYELTLGDGTKRSYEEVESLPKKILGEEFNPIIAGQVTAPTFFQLKKETLPSGSQLLFSYDEEGHLAEIKMKNCAANKTLSWIHFSYEFSEHTAQVLIKTSDSREIIYHFSKQNNSYQLVKVEGSHCIPTSYEYDSALVKKNLPEGRFLEISYDQGKVKTLKVPHSQKGTSETLYSFAYTDGTTDVFNTDGIKTRYLYNNQFQLIEVKQYNENDSIYRTDRKFWGKSGLLLSKSIEDGSGCVQSYRRF